MSATAATPKCDARATAAGRAFGNGDLVGNRLPQAELFKSDATELPGGMICGIAHRQAFCADDLLQWKVAADSVAFLVTRLRLVTPEGEVFHMRRQILSRRSERTTQVVEYDHLDHCSLWRDRSFDRCVAIGRVPTSFVADGSQETQIFECHMAKNNSGASGWRHPISLPGRGSTNLSVVHSDSFRRCSNPTAISVVGDIAWVAESKFALRNDPNNKDPGPWVITPVTLP